MRSLLINIALYAVGQNVCPMDCTFLDAAARVMRSGRLVRTFRRDINLQEEVKILYGARLKFGLSLE